MSKKNCSKCGAEPSLRDLGGTSTWCRRCHAAHAAQWREENPERVEAQNRARSARDDARRGAAELEAERQRKAHMEALRKSERERRRRIERERKRRRERDRAREALKPVEPVDVPVAAPAKVTRKKVAAEIPVASGEPIVVLGHPEPMLEPHYVDGVEVDPVTLRPLSDQSGVLAAPP